MAIQDSQFPEDDGTAGNIVEFPNSGAHRAPLWDLFNRLTDDERKALYVRMVWYTRSVTAALRHRYGSDNLPHGLQVDDIIQDALFRVFSGSRVCPATTFEEFCNFLTSSVIRSIVSALIERVKKGLSDTYDSSSPPEIPDMSIDVHQTYIHKQLIRELNRILVDRHDTISLLILPWIFRGVTNPIDIMNILSIGETECAGIFLDDSDISNAKRRIRNTLRNILKED